MWLKYSEIIIQSPILLLANCLKKIPSAEVDSSSASYRKVPRVLWNQKVHFLVKSAASVFHPELHNPSTLPSYFLKVPINVIFMSIGTRRHHCWLRNGTTSRKVAGSNLDGVSDLLLPVTLLSWGRISL